MGDHLFGILAQINWETAKWSGDWDNKDSRGIGTFRVMNFAYHDSDKKNDFFIYQPFITEHQVCAKNQTGHSTRII